MSSIGSIGVVNSFAMQCSNANRGGSTGDLQSTMKSNFEQAVKDAGGSNVDLDSLENQIQSAVKDVLSNVDSSSDPKQVGSQVQRAIDSTLKQNGIDPDKVKSELQSISGDSRSFGGPRGMPPTGRNATESNGSTSLTNENTNNNSISRLLQNLSDSIQSSSQSQTSSTSSNQSSSSAQSTDDLLQQLVKQLIQNLPSGSGVNVAA